MKYPSIPLAQLTISLCKLTELRHIVLSPGSRNAPLTIGFTEHPYFKTYSIVDERSAAFFALGIAQQTQEPVALVCTSGSALLNYYPAIAEAFYSRIPLVILSADRPAEYIDIGDGQTIRQPNVYANHILYNANCQEGAEIETNQREIYQAIEIAKSQMGPVHVNLPFSEPLYEKVEECIAIDTSILPSIESLEWKEDSATRYLDQWNTAEKKMVVVGVLSPGSLEQKYVDLLLKDPSVIVLTETTSNLHGPHIIPTIDMLLEGMDEMERQMFQPDLLLTFGGFVVSKKIKAFLRAFPPILHWHVDKYRALDTYFVLSRFFQTHIQEFLSVMLTDNPKTISNYQQTFWNRYQKRIHKRAVFASTVPYSDFGVYHRVFDHLPDNSILHLSNSATIRYAQLFALNPTVAVFCNRGTSGIDGSTSTAIGGAVASDRQTILVTGDLSFFYDSNALWNEHTPSNFRIIIINNKGGGIFRIIPGPKKAEKFSTYFETQHTLTAKHLARMYDYDYLPVTDYTTLEVALFNFFDETDRPKIMEVFTPREKNEEILQEYFKFIQTRN